MDKGPIIGTIKFRTKGRKDLKRVAPWANRVDLSIAAPNRGYGYKIIYNLTPFNAAYHLLGEVYEGSEAFVPKEMTAKFAEKLEQLPNQQKTFRKLEILSFIEMEKAREVVEG